MKAYIEPYSLEMREEVLELQLRDEDIREVYASSKCSAREALRLSLDSSKRTWVIKYDENIIAVFGVSIHPTDKAIGIPWLLGSQMLHNLKYRIVKYSSLIVETMFFFDEVTLLTNYASIYHTEAIKWLTWLGFSFIDEEVFLVDKDIPFKQFIKWKVETT